MLLLRDVITRLADALFAVDTRSLAAFRILLAIAQLIKLWEVVPHAQALLSDEGVLPRRLFLRDAPIDSISLYYLNGSLPFVLLLLAVHTLAVLALLVGYRSRLAALLAWILSISLTLRNPLINTGGDSLSNLMLFWAIFLPIGASYSVDAALAPEQAKPSRYLSVATVGVLLQALYVYFFGALLKTGADWANGTAVYAAMHVETVATHMAHWFRQFFWATYPLTFFVLWIELLSPILLFFPYRTSLVRVLVLPLYAAMHIGFRIFLSIGNFWVASLASLMPFLPTRFWTWLDNRYWRSFQRRIVIYYDRECEFCRKVSLVLRQFFLPKEAEVLPAQDSPEIGRLLEQEQSWVVTDGNGGRLLHWRALVFVVGQSLLFLPLAWLLALYGAIGLGRPTYWLIGNQRRALGRLTSGLKPRPFRPLSAVTQVGLWCAIAFCLAWNLRSQARVTADPPYLKPVIHVARVLRLTQGWGMFAPFPQAIYVVPVVEGRLSDGRTVDVLNGHIGPPSYAWPRYPIDAVRSSPWRRYFDNLGVHSESVAPDYLNGYATYACNLWNRSHSVEEQMTRLAVTLLIGQTLPDNRTDTSQRRVFRYICSPLDKAGVQASRDADAHLFAVVHPSDPKVIEADHSPAHLVHAA